MKSVAFIVNGILLSLFFVIGTYGADVLHAKNGDYVFPVAADPDLLAWTEYHWDGGNAVDIGAAPELQAGDPEFHTVTAAPVVAVVSGRAYPLDNLRGGISVVLQGNDGRQYYYAHLRERTVHGEQQVQKGEVLGFIGSTGQWAQYLEPHLHFSVASGHHLGYIWETDINAARFFSDTFGLDWRHRRNAVYSADEPSGWPFPEAGAVLESYADTVSVHRDRGALVLQPPAAIPLRGNDGGSLRVPVIAPMAGVISFSRQTPFGPRVQITDETNGHLIALFGVHTHLRGDGMAVRRGQLLGWIEPDDTLRLQYFRYGRPTDYQPLLDSSRDLLE
ncbi:MAG: peptidoglycan DD-metalloendopeptidase family protein [Spirochaeta sp.]